MAGSTASRRVSEFLGVAMFALALITLLALASYSPSDPVWFFNTGSDLPPGNFAGRVGAFIAELSYQLLGYSAYLLPVVLVVIGWHYFWCRAFDAVYTKAVGAGLLFACVSSFLSMAFGTLEVSGKKFRAGGMIGDWVAAGMAAYLNRTGSIVLILTLLFLAIILSTQFSFGRFFSAVGQMSRDRLAAAAGALREWRDRRRRDRQRQEVIKKHLDKAAASESKTKIAAKPGPVIAPDPAGAAPATARTRPESAPRKPAVVESKGVAPTDESAEPARLSSRAAAMMEAAAVALKAASARPTPPPAIKRPAPTPPPAPPPPAAELDRAPAERK